MKKLSRSLDAVTDTVKSIQKFTNLLRHRPKPEDPGEEPNGCDISCDNDVLDLPAVPTTVVPLYKDKMVLLKIGASYLKVGLGSRPVVSRTQVPLYLPINDCSVDSPKHVRDLTRALAQFDYWDYTFIADESASIVESYYRSSRAFFHIKLGVVREREDWIDPSQCMDYMTSRRIAQNRHEVTYSLPSIRTGQWWRLTAVGRDQYLCESLSCPGYCLSKGRYGLGLSGPLTRNERISVAQGRWDLDRTLTIVPLPDFAVGKPCAWIT